MAKKPQDTDTEPQFFYRAKLQHKDTGDIDRICLVARSDEMMLINVKAVAKIFGCRVIKVYGKRPFSPKDR
jgi:hypothetical protein